jgi:hypothetical protein
VPLAAKSTPPQPSPQPAVEGREKNRSPWVMSIRLN